MRQAYRGNNFSFAFPLLSSFSGQSVIVPSIDAPQGEGDKNFSTPQALFLENIMPMAEGFQSVGFSLGVAQGPGVDFDKAFYLRDNEERRTLFVPANGKNYFYDAPNYRWRSQPEATPFGAAVSVVNVKGRQFVFYAGHSTVFEWDGFALVPVVLVGLDPLNLLGLVSANAYLIAHTEREVFWSSVLEPTDFTPSLVTGAGGEAILSIKGSIVCAKPISDGYLLYTTANIVCASYSGNIRFPWVFKEISGGAGIDDPEKVVDDVSGSKTFAYTVAGMMQLDKNQAAIVWPQVTEFLAGRRFERYNYALSQIEEVDTNDLLLTKVSMIANRYIVISYGDNELTYALIYDISLKRWGKIAIPHVDCFEFIDQPIGVELGIGIRYRDIEGTYEEQTLTYRQYGHLTLGPALRYVDLTTSYQGLWQTYLELGGLPQPGIFIAQGQEPMKSIGFLQKGGTVKVVNFDLPLENQTGVLYLGHYQLTRNRLVELYEAWFENMQAESKVTTFASLDGFNLEKGKLCRRDKEVSKGRLQKFLCYESATSVVLRLEGKFQLSSYKLIFGQAGYR